MLTRSIRDSETSIDFVQGPPGSRSKQVKLLYFTSAFSGLWQSSAEVSFDLKVCSRSHSVDYD